jgi:hypothetical protein
MKKTKVVLITISLSVIGLTGLQAQDALPASGGNASGSGGTANYTVGQVVYITKEGSNGSASQGVQQPFEISDVTGIEEKPGNNLHCSVYPNPATDILILKIEGELQMQYVISVYDLNGKLLESKKILSLETSIDMINFVAGTYFLKVTEKDTEVKTFKIIKN